VPLIVILPVSLLADDTGAAILRSNGSVLVNRNSAPASYVLFVHDFIETQKNAAARIEATGSAADISPETVVQFDGDELVLDHGSLSVNTSRTLRVRAGCVVITPVNADWTQYEVSDLAGQVTVSALKSDVYIESRAIGARPAKPSARSDRVMVREGEQKSRDEKCSTVPVKSGAPVAGVGAILNSPYAIGTAVGIIAATCLALCRHDNPVSPSDP
jgi:hypothetical protein